MHKFSSEGYKVRLLKREEIPRVLDLCKAEGRHMGLEPEVLSWFKFDPRGFFVAVSDSGKKIDIFCYILIAGIVQKYSF